MLSIDSAHLRLIWGLVESNGHMLCSLSDEALCFWVLSKIRDRIFLSSEDAGSIEAYLSERTNLIRDVVSEQIM